IRLDPIDQTCRKHLDQAKDYLLNGQVVRQHFPSEACWHLETLARDAGTHQGDPWIVEPDPLLLIVGAGHCGVALAHAAASLGFRIILQDDRPEMARPSELPAHTFRSYKPVDQTLDSFDRHSLVYAALVTRSYQQDLEAMQHLAQRPLLYTGLIGSRRRLAHVMKMLREHDIPETFIESIDAPIGIDLPVETPEEIAISICARLIQVRNAACNRPASMDMETTVSLEC
ncbi:MAG: XdhC family protein, partial [Phycisphaerales bacterium]|nr:XdhC family protein [Phycisphaerales bacterium]